MLCSSCGSVNPSGSRFCMSCGTSLEAAPEPADLAPADLGSVEPVSGDTSPPVVVEPPSADPLLSEPVSAPSTDWSAPVSAEPEPPPPTPEPVIPEPPTPATSWEAPAPVEPTPAPTWSAPEASAPEVSAPTPAPSWEPPAPAQPAWTPPPPAAPAPQPQPQPMPPPPNPSPGDPFALGAAAQRLDAAAQAAARTALVATAAVMVAGERVEAVTQGRLDGAAAVLTLTDRRLLAVNQRDWAPLVTWFTIEPQLDVQAWEDQSGATIVLSAAGRQVTLDTITDKQPAYELVARLRARLGR